MPPKHPWLGLVVFLVVCFAAAGIGGAVTTPKIATWYATLAKPSWNPPNWIFGPVWSALYFCMAVAAWLVWRQGGFSGAKLPLTLFAVQLVLNVLWSCIFFGLENPGLAFVEVLLLWLAIAATMVDVLAAVDGRRNPVRAVLGLGQFRQRLEFHDLADEWVGQSRPP